MLPTKEIKRKIKSIKNIQKMAKALELISAVKMRKAVSMVLASRPYSQSAWEILKELSLRLKDTKNPLLYKPVNFSKGLFILISSNRGLCGAFNSKVVEKALETTSKFKEEEFITFGKRGALALKLAGKKIIADFPKEDLTRTIEQILPLANFAIQKYLKGEADQVILVYTDYYSPLKQIPRAKRILPVSTDQEKELGVTEKTKEIVKEGYSSLTPYTIEPSPEELLPYVVRRLVELQIYQAVLESEASEQSARMMAMKNAKEASQELIENLTLEYNKARQASITKEIAEITSGKLKINN